MTQRPELSYASTSLLDIAYEASGPDTDRSVILLHGWPDDVRTWDRLLPSLHDAGFRTFVPYLRGFGPTRFRDVSSMRSGQLSALGRDVWEFADAIGLERFSIVGHDWGARAAYITACLMPERVKAIAALSVGWGTNSPDQALSLEQAQNYWYHWLMALPRGERIVRDDRRNFVRHIWSIWNPGWSCSDEELEDTLSAFSNPDWADVTLHSYRVRWGHAPRDPSCTELEARLSADPTIRVPTLVLHGGGDPCNAPSTSEGKEAMFASAYERYVLPALGHFPQRQDAAQVAGRLIPFLALNSKPT